MSENNLQQKTKHVKKQNLKSIKKLPAHKEAVDNLLEMAINKDLDIQKLEKLIELKTKEEDRFCKREFDFHFAEMQKDFIPVQKNREVKRENGEILYEYNSLNNLLKVYRPIINNHGFSYRWDEETINEGKEKRIWCIVSGYGHEIRTPVDVPILPSTRFTNSTQQRGSSTTYGKRYSFRNAFGIVEDDAEDGDAQSCVDTKVETKNTNIELVEEVSGKISPELCVKLINNLNNPILKIGFAKRLNLIRDKANSDPAKIDILVKNIKDIKRHNSASFLNELDKELWKTQKQGELL